MQNRDGVTSVNMAQQSNGDFGVIEEYKELDQYYLRFGKYNFTQVKIDPFFISSSSTNAPISQISDTTKSSLLFSEQTMNPVITARGPSDFLIGALQGITRSATLTIVHDDASSQSIPVDSRALGLFPPGEPQTWNIWNLPDSAHWAENAPNSLSLLTLTDNRFLYAQTTVLYTITADVIGLPIDYTHLENFRKVAPYHAAISVAGYLANGSPITAPTILEQDDVSFTTPTVMLLENSINNQFIVAYYSTAMDLVARRCSLDSTIKCGSNLIFSANTYGVRTGVSLGMYHYVGPYTIPNPSFPLFAYEARNNIDGNQQVWLGATAANPLLISSDNQQGQFDDVNPRLFFSPNDDYIYCFFSRYTHSINLRYGSCFQQLDNTFNAVQPISCFGSQDTSPYRSDDYEGLMLINNPDPKSPGPVCYELDQSSGVLYPELPAEKDQPVLGMTNLSLNYTYVYSSAIIFLGVCAVMYMSFLLYNSKTPSKYKALVDCDEEAAEAQQTQGAIEIPTRKQSPHIQNSLFTGVPNYQSITNVTNTQQPGSLCSKAADPVKTTVLTF